MRNEATGFEDSVSPLNTDGLSSGRLFVGFSQRAGPVGTFARELLEHAALVFEYWHGFVSGKLSRIELQRWMLPVRRRFEILLARIVAADIRGFSGSCANLLKHAEALWIFVDVTDVEPTNNLAERDVRSFVIWRTLCYGCQSEGGLRFGERVMTVAMTLRKRGRGVLDFIEGCVRAHFASVGRCHSPAFAFKCWAWSVVDSPGSARMRLCKRSATCSGSRRLLCALFLEGVASLVGRVDVVNACWRAAVASVRTCARCLCISASSCSDRLPTLMRPASELDSSSSTLGLNGFLRGAD